MTEILIGVQCFKESCSSTPLGGRCLEIRGNSYEYTIRYGIWTPPQGSQIPCGNQAGVRPEGPGTQSERRSCRPVCTGPLSPFLEFPTPAPILFPRASNTKLSVARHSLTCNSIITRMLECDLTPAGDPQESQCRLAWMHQGRGERSLVWGMRNSSLCPASKSSMVTLAVARDDILAARHPGHASKHSHWMDPRFANYQGGARYHS